MKNYIMMLLVLSIAGCESKKNSDGGSSDSTNVAELTVQEIEGEVFFISPTEGDTVGTNLSIKMGVKGMEIEPAGMVNEGKGHHHLIINGSYVEKGVIVPADSTHIHYGKGQTEAEVQLGAGTHTLTLQFADGVHASYGEKWSKTITVYVNE